MSRKQHRYSPDASPTTLAELAAKGPSLFSAPDPLPAFDEWWSAQGYPETYKPVAKAAWNEAMRLMNDESV